jgi:hypothetical protein
MVQVIPARQRQERPSFLQSILGGVGQALPGAVDSYNQHSREMEKLGVQARNKQQEMASKLQGDSEIEDRDYSVIEDRWGKEAADIWRASDPGAKTELVRHFLNEEERNKPGYIPGNEGFLTDLENEEQTNPKDKIVDYDLGLTPKERTSRQNARYSTNLPLYQEAQKKLDAANAEEYHLDILEELSPRITTLDKFNINPMTGELLIPQAGSEDAQRFVKTINDFTVHAKDSYGSRVTNFDLSQFMKRLPTLANSEEGRRQIIEQMKIINKMNLLREKTLQDVIDRHGGIRNIDFDKAQKLTDKKISKQMTDLKKQFTNIDKKSSGSYKQEVDSFRKKVPNGSVLIRTNEGQLGYLPKEQVKDFLKDKAGEVL